MARSSHVPRNAASAASGREGRPRAGVASPSLLLAEAPLLLALGLAPLVAGYQDPLPPLALGCLVWLSLLLRLFLPGSPPLPAPRAPWLVLLFPLLALVSLVYSDNRGATLMQTALFASLAAGLWLAADVVRRGGAFRLLAALLVGALIVSGLGLREHLETLKRKEAAARVYGTFTNPNFLAGYVVPSLLLALSLAFRVPEGFKTWTWGMVLGLLTASVAAAAILTGSFGGMLSLAAGGLVFLLLGLLRGGLRERPSLARLALLVGISLAVFAALSAPLRTRITATQPTIVPKELCPRKQAGASDDSRRFRVLTWQGTARMGMKRPVAGWGAGTFDTAFAPHAIASFTKQAHSTYLQLFAEEGLLGVALLAGLLGAALYSAWRLPRGPEWSWVPGGAAALTAFAAHGLVDSLLYVGAVAWLAWTLLGMLLAVPGEGAPAAPQAAVRRFAAAGAALGLLLTGSQALGRAFLARAQADAGTSASAALESARTAGALLPWEFQVPRLESHILRRRGELPEAAEAAARVVQRAPDRPPGYLDLSNLQRGLRRDAEALATVDEGIRRAPNEVPLLFARARLLEAMGREADALESYRRILAVEESPAGQVHALAEVRDWRFARARMAAARGAAAAGDTEGAFEHRRAAACLLAERRGLHDGNPAVYIAPGDWDPSTERELRTDEENLWKQLAREYRSRGSGELARLCDEMTAKVDASRTRLEQIISEVEAAP